MNGNYRIQEIDPWPQIDIKSGLDFPYCEVLYEIIHICTAVVD